jgi:radical SAM superfamily enzyme YgiQ (UPF0313 family)
MHESAEDAPLGILTLAAVLRPRGIEPLVFNPNRSYYDYLERGRRQGVDFCVFAAQELSSMPADLFGFGTICNSYPLTIRMAEELRRLRPGVTIIMGGPQASVVDEESLQAFPWIDFVVRGEAEESLPKLIEALRGNGSLDQVPGITRRCGERIVRNPDAPLIADLDSLPLPAYDLHLAARENVDHLSLELGRGCPFTCTFCSTNDFFRRRFRLISPQRLLEQMMLLESTYGVRSFELVHDMFTIDRKRVVEFCAVMLASGKGYQWSCSARTDCVDEALLELMARAGCRGIFFGIETGSQRMQRAIDKDLDLEAAARVVECTQRHGIPVTVSFITGFPEETAQDFGETIEFLLNAVRHEKVSPQLHLLAPLAKTPLASRFCGELGLDAAPFGVCNLGWEQSPLDYELVRIHPSIFCSFYHLPTKLERRYLEEFAAFILSAAIHVRWLLLAIREETGDIMGFFHRWSQWRRDNRPFPAGHAAMKYYVEASFLEDLFLFLHTHYLSGNGDARGLVRAMLDYQIAWWTAAQEVKNLDAGSAASKSGPITITRDSVPTLSQRVRLVKVDAEASRAIHYLKTREEAREGESSMPDYLCVQNVGSRVEASSPSPLSARLLNLCDGRSTVGDILTRFAFTAAETNGLPGLSPQQICVGGLTTLGEQGLIEFSTPRQLALEHCKPAHLTSRA